MPLTSEDRKRLGSATELALKWHAEQHRKETQVPYVSHLLQVAGLVLEHGGGIDQAIAGLLHDCLEDAESPEERAQREVRISREFGEGVLATILACTDTQPDETLEAKRPWKQRKQRFLKQLSETNDANLLVATCDKRHNLYAQVWDTRDQGLAYLDRFNSTPDEQLWYYQEVLAIVRGRMPKRLVMELTDLVDQFRAEINR